MNEFLKDFSISALNHAIETNLFDFISLFRHWPQVEVHNDPDLLWTITDIPFPLFNDVLRVRVAPEDVNATIKTSINRCKSRNVPMMWWTGPSTSPVNLGTYLARHGFSQEEDETGMAVDLMKLNEDISTPTGLVIDQVSDMEMLNLWIHIFSISFGIPKPFDNAFLDLFASISAGARLSVYNYLGRQDGKPVATSTLFLSAGVAGIYNVATLPDARRQGMGAAMTLFPLLEAQALGYQVGILQASEMGKSVYQQLGFQECCKIRQYIWSGE
jgi:GNAT superfamily N-acetyltransferase